LWADSSSQHVVVDELLVSHDLITAASKALTKHQQQTAIDHLFGLQLQGVISKCVSETIENKNIEFWATTIDYLPSHLFNFARKALLQVVPTAANLKQWNRVQDAFCMLSASVKPQTNKHVLSNCGSLVALHCYTERHNKVLTLLIGWLKSVLAGTQIIYAALLDANILPVADLFNNYRPGIAIADSNSICTLEITVCHETNVVSRLQAISIKILLTFVPHKPEIGRFILTQLKYLHRDLSLTLMILPS